MNKDFFLLSFKFIFPALNHVYIVARVNLFVLKTYIFSSNKKNHVFVDVGWQDLDIRIEKKVQPSALLIFQKLAPIFFLFQPFPIFFDLSLLYITISMMTALQEIIFRIMCLMMMMIWSPVNYEQCFVKPLLMSSCQPKTTQ